MQSAVLVIKVTGFVVNMLCSLTSGY